MSPAGPPALPMRPRGSVTAVPLNVVPLTQHFLFIAGAVWGAVSQASLEKWVGSKKGLIRESAPQPSLSRSQAADLGPQEAEQS